MCKQPCGAPDVLGLGHRDERIEQTQVEHVETSQVSSCLHSVLDGNNALAESVGHPWLLAVRLEHPRAFLVVVLPCWSHCQRSSSAS